MRARRGRERARGGAGARAPGLADPSGTEGGGRTAARTRVCGHRGTRGYKTRHTRIAGVHAHASTHTHTCAHAHGRACMHTPAHIHARTYTHAHANVHMLTCTHAHIHVHAHRCVHIHAPTHPHQLSIAHTPPPQQLGTGMQLTTHCTRTHTHGILHIGTVHCTYPRPARCVHTLLPARMHSMHACCSPPALHVCWCCCAWARGRGGSAASESARVCTHVCVCVCVPGQKAQQNPRHSTWPCSRGLFAFLQGRGQILSRCRGPSPSLPRCIMQLGQAKPPRCVLVPPSSVPSPAATQSCHQGQPIARPVALEDSQMLAAAGTLSLGVPAELGTPRFGTPCPTVQGRGLAQVAPQGWRCAPVSCPPDLPLLLPSCASKSGRRMWSGREVARVGVPPCKCLGLPARLLTPCSS